MFLNKKTTTNCNKNKPKTNTQKPLGGWGDDDQHEERSAPVQLPFQSPFQQQQQPSFNLLQTAPKSITPMLNQNKSSVQNVSEKKMYFDWDQLNDMTDIGFEKKLVERIVEPGGVRIKPSDVLLSQFLKEARTLNMSAIGSLLLSKIQVNYPFQVKAKSLYTIEYLVKKNQQYSVYFKLHNEKLAEFPQPEDNVENYRKILKNVLNVIGMQTKLQQKEEQLTFVDPQYNDTKQSQLMDFITKNDTKNKKNQGKKKLISPLEAKKMAKEKKVEKTEVIDLLGSEEVQESPTDIKKSGIKKEKESVNLLDVDETEKKSSDIKFDDLLGKEKKKEKEDLLDIIL